MRYVQLQLISILEKKYVLLLPNAAQDIDLSELGIGPLAPVTAHGPLQVFIKFAMQDYRDKRRATEFRGVAVVHRGGCSEAARGLRIREDPGDIAR